MLKRVCAFLAAVYLFFLPLLALAECTHENAQHFLKLYESVDKDDHRALTYCICPDCGGFPGCHANTGWTPRIPHTWASDPPKNERYTETVHKVTQSRRCTYCNETDVLIYYEAHSYHLVGNYHGVGDVHFNVYQCSVSGCGQNMTESYYCPGSNCVVINSMNDESLE